MQKTHGPSCAPPPRAACSLCAMRVCHLTFVSNVCAFELANLRENKPICFVLTTAGMRVGWSWKHDRLLNVGTRELLEKANSELHCWFSPTLLVPLCRVMMLAAPSTEMRRPQFLPVHRSTQVQRSLQHRLIGRLSYQIGCEGFSQYSCKEVASFPVWLRHLGQSSSKNVEVFNWQVCGCLAWLWQERTLESWAADAIGGSKDSKQKRRHVP